MRCMFCEAKLPNKAASRRLRKKPMCFLCFQAGPIDERSEYRCKGKNSAGKHCRHYALEDEDYCSAHRFQGEEE